ncbi:hypothetical protein [Afipia sp. P52-10]|uniref:hypothetical protein n=1 Tax=Afipia sp. P52-10 TaxID=1429916 RepID=UPI001268A0EC|nr:hypothetical protein [Afipia sp. P52-10]
MVVVDEVMPGPAPPRQSGRIVVAVQGIAKWSLSDRRRTACRAAGASLRRRGAKHGSAGSSSGKVGRD